MLFSLLTPMAAMIRTKGRWIIASEELPSGP